MQSRNRDTDVENECMDTSRRRSSRTNWGIGIDIGTLLCIKEVTNESLPYEHRELHSRFCGDLNGTEIQKRGYIYIYIYV